jgi:AhpD family alkylhydroperoxidase
MAFIGTIPPSEAEGPVREMHEQAQKRSGYVPNWAQAFSLRPEVRGNLPVRSYELATLAAARALGSSYCALAHGSVLAEKVFDAATVAGIATDAAGSPLDPAERALMAFAEKIARRADQITSALTVGRPVADRPAASLPEPA